MAMKYRDILFNLLSITGWVIISITLIWALFHDNWYAFQLNGFGEVWIDLVIVILVIIFMIYYFIHKIKEI